MQHRNNKLFLVVKSDLIVFERQYHACLHYQIVWHCHWKHPKHEFICFSLSNSEYITLRWMQYWSWWMSVWCHYTFKLLLALDKMVVQWYDAWLSPERFRVWLPAMSSSSVKEKRWPVKIAPHWHPSQMSTFEWATGPWPRPDDYCSTWLTQL